MDIPRKITHEQFKHAVKELLFKKPGKNGIPDDYEPTQEELKEVFKVPSEQDKDETR